MQLNRNLLYAGAAAVLVLALVVGFAATRSQQAPINARPDPTATPTTPAPTATATSVAPSPTSIPAGAITGRVGYPSDFHPAGTVYAISVGDPRVFFSVDFAEQGNPPRRTAAPGEGQTYTLTGITPGTYHVIAYRNDGETSLGVYSRHTVNCDQATTPGQGSTPAPGCPAADYSLVPVTVRAGETTSRIDLTTWVFGPQAAPYPARPTPTGFVLPQGCSYVGTSATGGPTRTEFTEWRFTCGGAPDSAQRVSAALNQQGWTACRPQPGIAEWWKGAMMTRVTPNANANENPVLMQLARFMTNCP